MGQPFDTMLASLQTSPLSTPVTYLPANGAPIAVNGFVRQTDIDHVLHANRARQQVNVIEIPVASFGGVTPAKNDTVQLPAGATPALRVIDVSRRDPQSLLWTIEAAPQ